MRDLQVIYDSYPSDLRILAVNLGESEQAVRRWVRQHGLTYDVLLDKQRTVASRYQVRGLPTTYVLDGDLLIRHLYYGQVSLAQLRQDLNTLKRKA